MHFVSSLNVCAHSDYTSPLFTITQSSQTIASSVAFNTLSQTWVWHCILEQFQSNTKTKK